MTRPNPGAMGVICNPLLPATMFDGLKGVIFDCDGVLFDSWESNRQFYNLVLNAIGADLMTPTQEQYVHSHSVHDSLAHIAPPGRLEDLYEARRGIHYGRDILPHLQPESGLDHLLPLLRQLEMRLAVNTNRATTTEWLLERFGFDRFFSPVVTASMVRPKPSPEGVFRILEAWGLDRDKVAYIGDSVVDERTALAAGVRFWSFRNPALLAEMHIPDFWTLHAVFRRRLARERGAGSTFFT